MADIVVVGLGGSLARPSRSFAALEVAMEGAAADGLIWSSPMYHGTISGSFKNALDWLQLLNDRAPPYLTDKIIGLISTAGGMQGLQAVNTMEFIRGWAVPLVMPIGQAWRIIDDDGEVLDQRTADQLRVLGQEVVHAARHFAVPLNTPPEVELAEAQQQPITEEAARL